MILADILLGLPVIGFWVFAMRRELARGRAYRTETEIARIKAGLADNEWNGHTPVEPLRAVAWPARQSPSDVAAAYQPLHSPEAQWPWRTGYVIPPDWDAIVADARVYTRARVELARICAVLSQYEQLELAVLTELVPA